MNELQHDRILFLLVIGFFTCLITVLIGTEFDPYWHIKVGEWIVSHHEVPHTGIFSQTRENTPWIAHSWLSAVLMYGIFHIAGWPGLIVMAVVATTAGIFIMLGYLLEKLSPIRALCLTLLSYGMLLAHIMPRPHILALPVMTYWFVQMLRASEKYQAPPLYQALILILWANIHGSFLIGIAYACFFAFESVVTAPEGINRIVLSKQWAKFLAVSLLCLLVTPYGLQGVLLPLQLTGQSYSMSIISEWASPNFQQFQFLEILLYIILGFALTQKMQLPVLRLLLLIGLIHLSLKHGRYSSDLMALQVPLLFAAPLANHWHELVPDGKRFTLFSLIPANGKGKLLLISVLGCWLIYIFAYKDIEYKASKKINALLSSIKKADLPGNVFSHYNHGGYFIYQGLKPFIDSRAELYQDDYIKAYEEAEHLTGGEKPLVKLLNQYHIGWSFLPPETPAIAYFNLHPDWLKVFSNSCAVIHVRKGLWPPQVIADIRSGLEKQSGNDACKLDPE
ncbi:MAG: hypothetical protein PHI13_13835 [Methylococcales bacterium]|nr:hypothetical protein [Methylococcales bacterium]